MRWLHSLPKSWQPISVTLNQTWGCHCTQSFKGTLLHVVLKTWHSEEVKTKSGSDVRRLKWSMIKTSCHVIFESSSYVAAMSPFWPVTFKKKTDILTVVNRAPWFSVIFNCFSFRLSACWSRKIKISSLNIWIVDNCITVKHNFSMFSNPYQFKTCLSQLSFKTVCSLLHQQ